MTPNPDDPRCPLCKDTGEVLINSRADWDAEGPLWGFCECAVGQKNRIAHEAEAERQTQAFRQRQRIENGETCTYGVDGCDADSEPHPENRCECHHADYMSAGVDMAEMLRDE